MIVLHFCMQGDYIFEEPMASVACLNFSKQEEDIVVDTNGKCYVCTL